VRLEGGHSRILFDIVPVPPATPGASWRALTTSMDRQVAWWDLATAAPAWSLPTLGGFAYAVDVSTLDPSRVAVAVGDNSIRVLSVGDVHNPFAGAMLLWRGIQAKVTAVRQSSSSGLEVMFATLNRAAVLSLCTSMQVAWHPVVEGLLAFGTEEGQLGVMDADQHQCHILPTGHRKTVYALSWMPAPAGKASTGTSGSLWRSPCCGALLSAGGDSQLLVTDVGAGTDRATPWPAWLGCEGHALAAYSEVHVSPADPHWVAVGTVDGSVELWSVHDRTRPCRALHFQGHTGLVNRLRFSPGQCRMDTA